MRYFLKGKAVEKAKTSFGDKHEKGFKVIETGKTWFQKYAPYAGVITVIVVVFGYVVRVVVWPNLDTRLDQRYAMKSEVQAIRLTSEKKIEKLKETDIQIRLTQARISENLKAVSSIIRDMQQERKRKRR